MYNLVIDHTNTVIGYGQEPVSIDNAKAYCRVDPGISNPAQDQLFAYWITAARQAIEHNTGLSLVPKSVVAYLQNPQGNMELPFGPVTSTPVYLDQGSNVITFSQVNGSQFPSIVDTFDYCQASYQAGYTNDNIPDEIRIAILNQVVSWYENRGDEAIANMPASVLSICQKYSRIGLLG